MSYDIRQYHSVLNQELKRLLTEIINSSKSVDEMSVSIARVQLAMDIGRKLEELKNQEIKEYFDKVPFVKPSPIENPFGLDINAYQFGAKKSSSPMSFLAWLKECKKVKLRPADKRYGKYYQQYRREIKKNGLLK